MPQFETVAGSELEVVSEPLASVERGVGAVPTCTTTPLHPATVEPAAH